MSKAAVLIALSVSLAGCELGSSPTAPAPAEVQFASVSYTRVMPVSDPRRTRATGNAITILEIQGDRYSQTYQCGFSAYNLLIYDEADNFRCPLNNVRFKGGKSYIAYVNDSACLECSGARDIRLDDVLLTKVVRITGNYSFESDVVRFTIGQDGRIEQ